MSKRKVLITVFGVIAVFLVFTVNFIRGRYVTPIIMYHSVTPAASPRNMLAITDATFERQMDFLKSRRYNVVPLETLAAMIREKKRIPPKTISITFDDGYKDNYIYAFPILKKYNLPATLFVIINEVERPDRVSWDEIKQMQDSGLITIGSHTIGPQPLIDYKSKDELKKQIFDSKKVLEEKLGLQVNTFSYPGGMFNSAIRQLVIDAGYKCAVATNPGKKFPSDDIFALKRLRISSNCHNLFVYWVETSGYYNLMREYRRKKK